MKKLKPSKNYRFKNPKVCGRCDDFIWGDGFGECKRPDRHGFDTGDGFQWFYGCDYWKKVKHDSNQVI